MTKFAFGFVIILLCLTATWAISSLPTHLAFATYLGGTLGDHVTDLYEDPKGNVYITGYTFSRDFPVMSSAFQKRNSGQADGFVAKISPTGHVIYCTYLGGERDDWPKHITADENGRAIVAGDTKSAQFPLKHPLRSVGQSGEAFLMMLNARGTDLVFSTLIGGDQDDEAVGLGVDAIGNIYVGLRSRSANLILTRPIHSDPTGIYLVKFSPLGRSILFASYFGGTGGDGLSALQADAQGNVYIAGSTQSNDFPTRNAMFPVRGQRSLFYAKLGADQNIIFSSYFGGYGNEQVNDIAVDASSNLYMIGTTTSFRAFPIRNAFQPRYGGSGQLANYDSFVTKIGRGGRNMIYSSYLGGNSGDNALRVAADTTGSAFIIGWTISRDFPRPLVGSKDFHRGFLVKVSPGGFHLADLVDIPPGASPGGLARPGLYAGSDEQFSFATETSNGHLPTFKAFQKVPGGGIDAYVVRSVP